jgi:asparagine synthase (glutamine-hydrolysing)
MCGIAGILNINERREVSSDTLERMLSAIRHRGPDEFGIYSNDHVGFAHARLSIIDLSGGQQPMSNEDGKVWITFNGEIFNYLELRKDLLKRGHSFSTHSDTEVIVHLYEEYGEGCLEHLNGQFAFAIWDGNNRKLFLARDRAGIRPLFYSSSHNKFYFASEIKAIFATGEIERNIDPSAIDQIFTLWCTVSPATAFKGVYELPPGHYLLVQDGNVLIRKYWDIDFSDDLTGLSFAEAKERLRYLLTDATMLQLRADVPVGAYLSGGLDSSVTTALIRQLNQSPLMTFSVAFEDKDYDESQYQREMASALGVEHHEVRCKYSDIGDNFPEVIWHTEKPILRTAPAPLFLLSKLVRDNGLKVVLTGEGADEVLGGYDIFKETKIRQFCARFPESRRRPLLLKKLYPYLPAFQNQSGAYKEVFFSDGISDVSDPLFSHRPRWKTTSMTRLFFSEELKEMAGKDVPEDSLLATMSAACKGWPP